MMWIATKSKKPYQVLWWSSWFFYLSFAAVAAFVFVSASRRSKTFSLIPLEEDDTTMTKIKTTNKTTKEQTIQWANKPPRIPPSQRIPLSLPTHMEETIPILTHHQTPVPHPCIPLPHQRLIHLHQLTPHPLIPQHRQVRLLLRIHQQIRDMLLNRVIIRLTRRMPRMEKLSYN